MVEQFERYAAAMGDRYLRDLVDLRAGEEWNPGLERMIREADVFQLFWSQNSMKSEFCRQEWEYALALNRPNFIRPTYWEQPFPEEPPRFPPEQLRAKHFQLLGRYITESPSQSELQSDTDSTASGSRTSTHIDSTGPGSAIEFPSPSTVNAEAPASTSHETGGSVDVDMDFEMSEDADFDSSAGTFEIDDIDDFDDPAPDGEVIALDDESDECIAFDDMDYEAPQFDDESDDDFACGSPAYSAGRGDEWQAPAASQEFVEEMPLAQRLAIFVVCAVVLLGGVIGAAFLLSDEGPEADNSEVRHSAEPIELSDEQIGLTQHCDGRRDPGAMPAHGDWSALHLRTMWGAIRSEGRAGES